MTTVKIVTADGGECVLQAADSGLSHIDPSVEVEIEFRYKETDPVKQETKKAIEELEKQLKRLREAL